MNKLSEIEMNNLQGGNNTYNVDYNGNGTIDFEDYLTFSNMYNDMLNRYFNDYPKGSNLSNAVVGGILHLEQNILPYIKDNFGKTA